MVDINFNLDPQKKANPASDENKSVDDANAVDGKVNSGDQNLPIENGIAVT